MRKKSTRINQHKTARRQIFQKGEQGDDTDWILLEADVMGEPQPSKQSGFDRPLLIRFLAIACLCVSMPIGLRWAHQTFFYENEEFLLQTMEFQSDGSLSRDQLIEVANVSLGANLMELDLERIQSRIEKLPVTKSVSVSREIPDTLRIDVEERVPVAWISCPPLGIRPGDMARGFLLDEGGVLFRCLDLTAEVETLPIIERFKMPEPKEGTVWEVDGVTEAISLIVGAAPTEGIEEFGIHLVRLRTEWSIECLYRNGLEVTFDVHEVKRGLEDLEIILERMEETGTALASVDVSVAQNIPVRFAEEIDESAIGVIAQPLESEPEEDENAQEKHLRSILNGG